MNCACCRTCFETGTEAQKTSTLVYQVGSSSIPRFPPFRLITWVIELGMSTPASSTLGEASSVTLRTVSDASIVGTLPDSLWNFDTLNSLTLTGNHGRTRPIPPAPTIDSETHWVLKSLDLHGNGSNGTISEPLFSFVAYVEDLDFSSNRLEGSLPYNLRTLSYKVRTLNLSNNTLSGILPWNITDSLDGLLDQSCQSGFVK